MALLTLPTTRSAEPMLDTLAISLPPPRMAPAALVIPMPKLLIVSPTTSGRVTTEDPCLRGPYNPTPGEADRRDCEWHLQLPGGLRLDEGGNLVGDPTGAIRNAPTDGAEADRIAERLDLSLKARFGMLETPENPVDRERLPEIPVETWQKIEIRNRDNSR